MPMLTYRRVDGTYYDAFAPESPEDVPLPLRPSEIHEWNGAQWMWCRGDICHRHPRAADHVGETEAEAKIHDIHAMLHVGLGRLARLERGHGELKEKLETHLEETAGLPEALRDLRAAGRIARFVGMYVLPVMAGLAAFSLVVWAALHGDFMPLKKAIGLA